MYSLCIRALIYIAFLLAPLSKNWFRKGLLKIWNTARVVISAFLTIKHVPHPLKSLIIRNREKEKCISQDIFFLIFLAGINNKRIVIGERSKGQRATANIDFKALQCKQQGEALVLWCGVVFHLVFTDILRSSKPGYWCSVHHVVTPAPHWLWYPL